MSAAAAPARSVPADPGAALAPFVRAGVFGPYERHLVTTVARLAPGMPGEVALALAVAARAPTRGHVCVVLDEVPRVVAATAAEVGSEIGAGDVETLPWPDARAWATALERSDLVARPDRAAAPPLRPLVWDGTRLYLQRYWAAEVAVAGELLRRAPAGGKGNEEGGAVDAVLDRLFPSASGRGPDADPSAAPDRQRQAVRGGVTAAVSVVAGGPGTGKTYTVARLLAAAALLDGDGTGALPLVMAAPTGKAAQRMRDSVAGVVGDLRREGVVSEALADRLAAVEALTLHRLLGARPGAIPTGDRVKLLPQRLVVVDETSMVSLPLMAALLRSLRPDARLVLVGDPDQLASVEVGTVLADVVGPTRDPGPSAPRAADPRTDGSWPLAPRITVLDRAYRFEAGSGIDQLGDAVRDGDADGAVALLRSGGGGLSWVAPGDAAGMARVEEELVSTGLSAATAARDGDAATALAAVTAVKVLAATRRGPLSVDDWTGRVERGVRRRAHDGGFGGAADGLRAWPVGRPVIVAANDPVHRIFNGDVGVVVEGEGGRTVAMDGEPLRFLVPSRLGQVETWWAMTIHRSQGSQFPSVVVSLPGPGSPVLSRELLYTAVTRARERLTMVATEEAVRAAVDRRLVRASGLGDRLWPR